MHSIDAIKDKISKDRAKELMSELNRLHLEQRRITNRIKHILTELGVIDYEIIIEKDDNK